MQPAPAHQNISAIASAFDVLPAKFTREVYSLGLWLSSISWKSKVVPTGDDNNRHRAEGNLAETELFRGYSFGFGEADQRSDQ
jgi:hypothetical protein